MVMIPIGNRTSHNFQLWVFVEIYVRLWITALLMSKLGELSTQAYWIAFIIFSLWAMRPLYVSIKNIYNSWVWAKHKAQSDALSNESKQDE